jgi:hypothetical protein
VAVVAEVRGDVGEVRGGRDRAQVGREGPEVDVVAGAVGRAGDRREVDERVVSGRVLVADLRALRVVGGTEGGLSGAFGLGRIVSESGSGCVLVTLSISGAAFTVELGAGPTGGAVAGAGKVPVAGGAPGAGGVPFADGAPVAGALAPSGAGAGVAGELWPPSMTVSPSSGPTSCRNSGPPTGGRAT